MHCTDGVVWEPGAGVWACGCHAHIHTTGTLKTPTPTKPPTHPNIQHTHLLAQRVKAFFCTSTHAPLLASSTCCIHMYNRVGRRSAEAGGVKGRGRDPHTNHINQPNPTHTCWCRCRSPHGVDSPPPPVLGEETSLPPFTGRAAIIWLLGFWLVVPVYSAGCVWVCLLWGFEIW